MAKRDFAERVLQLEWSQFHHRFVTKHTPYLYCESKKPPIDEPQMENAMATTPFHIPSSLAVMWWSSRKRGNMVIAPCSPVQKI